MEKDQRINQKIKSLDVLAHVISKIKKSGKKVVHCHGVFDLIHPGHFKHLQSAKRMGNVLVVTVTPDRFVKKGPGRPVFHETLRAESLAELESVDFVAINQWPTAVETIRLLRPNLYVKGKDYAKRERDVTGKIYAEEKAVQSIGGQIKFTSDIEFSSSHLINNFMSIFPPETEKWLHSFRKKFPVTKIVEYIQRCSELKVLVMGEAILDEYVFCDGLGKSNKDPILAFKYHSTEAHAGGALAVANHLAGFCKEVALLTMLGDRERKESFIRKSLAGNIRPYFITRENSPTIHKRRFVDSHTNARMFEIYLMNDASMSARTGQTLVSKLNGLLKKYDLVICADYGHGLFTEKAIQVICRRANFLAVNTQANAGNRGFNTISKYPKADYVCLAGHEVSLETRMKHANWHDLVLEVTKRIRCSNFGVTEGNRGILHYSKKNGFVEVPAFAAKVVDRVGAGDAVLALTSLLVYLKAPWETVGFVGNLVGAQMVADLGNRVTIQKTSLIQNINSLMK